MAIKRYNQCTIWRKGERDQVTGRETVGESRTYQCEVKRGGTSKFVDKTGEEFYPSSTFWVRESDLIDGAHSEPVQDELIAQGLHNDIAEPDTVNAEAIRAVTVHNHAKFGESDSYTIGTKA